MTGQALLETLQAMPPEWLAEELFGMCCSSGVSYDVGSVYPREAKSGQCEGGPVCEMTPGERYLEVSLD